MLQRRCLPALAAFLVFSAGYTLAQQSPVQESPAQTAPSSGTKKDVEKFKPSTERFQYPVLVLLT